MNKTSKILLILQVIALVGGIASGTFFAMGPVSMIGFFIPGIIAVVLHIKDKKKNQTSTEENK